ncbi:glucose-dependent insulinotropic receptor-like [Clytia hemisphaerica]|uniref:G-protein coupled receptors family 1 profile domain-containing protein n=1 Tax=Clytia hemisphaerica TaxID=252671 RepID=A0A7M6DKD0_9CNID
MTSTYNKILYQYVTTSIGALVIASNSIMLVCIRRSKAHKNKPVGFVYVINMAASDLFVGVTMVILKSMHPYMGTTLAENVVAQNIYHVVRFCMIRFSLLVSVFNLVALTIDRLCAIRFPFLVQRQDKGFHIKVCGLIWFVSLVITSIFYILARFYLKDSLRYKDAIFPIATIPATVLFVVSYTMIFTVVRRTSNTVNRIEASVRRRRIDTEGAGENNEERRPEEKEKIAFVRLAVKTVAVFVICWLPLSITSIYKLLSTEAPDRDLESSFFTLAFFNSLIDPFIYFAHLRRVIIRVVRRIMGLNTEMIIQPQSSERSGNSRRESSIKLSTVYTTPQNRTNPDVIISASKTDTWGC